MPIHTPCSAIIGDISLYCTLHTRLSCGHQSCDNIWPHTHIQAQRFAFVVTVRTI